MSEIDQQFVEYVVKSLVGKPDAVHIDRRIDEKGVLLELTVDPEDLGRVIGKRGATAQSLRTLLRALGTKNDARYNLKIVDNGVPRDNAQQSSAPSNDDSSNSDTTSENASSEESSSHDNNQGFSDESAKEDIKKEPIKHEQPKEDDKPSAESQTSDRLQRAREELADLDDLDV